MFPPAFDQVVGGWPCVLAIAAIGVTGVREVARRAALNEALHEVRRPLQVLALTAPVAGTPAGDFEGPVRMAAAALERLEREINGGGAPSAVRATVAAAPLLEAAVGRWQARAALAGRSLELRCRCGTAAVSGSPAELAQALDNLLANAIEHGGSRIAVRPAPAAAPCGSSSATPAAAPSDPAGGGPAPAWRGGSAASPAATGCGSCGGSPPSTAAASRCRRRPARPRRCSSCRSAAPGRGDEPARAGDRLRVAALARRRSRPRSPTATATGWRAATASCARWWSPGPRWRPGSGSTRAGRRARGAAGAGAVRAARGALDPAAGARAGAARRRCRPAPTCSPRSCARRAPAEAGTDARPAAAGRSRSRSPAPARCWPPARRRGDERSTSSSRSKRRAPGRGGPTSPPPAVPLLALGAGAEAEARAKPRRRWG